MRRFFLYLTSVFVLAFGGTMAKADSLYVWDISGTFTLTTCTTAGGCPPGTPTVTPGQTWSGSIAIDTTTGTTYAPPPASTLTFPGLLPPGQDFGTVGNTCDSTSTCTPTVGSPSGVWQAWSTVPVGTTFELEMCDNIGSSCSIWVVLDVDANGGKTSLVGFTGGTVLGGAEFGGVCSTTGIPSSPMESCASAIVSGTPLPASLPLLASGFAVLWAIFRRRKEAPGGSLDPVAA